MNEPDVDYLQNISESIHALYDGYLVSFDLSQDYLSSKSPNEYVLTINVQISVADNLRDQGVSSMGALSRGVIGDYRPNRIDQHQDFRFANNVLRFQYSISNLNEFISQLKTHAWAVYNSRMNNAIDSVLDKK